jgi:hypothetical protein
MTSVLVAAGLLMVVVPGRGPVLIAAAAGTGAVLGPVPAAGCALALGALEWRRRLAARRAAVAAADGDVTLLGELVLLGLRAGLTFPVALEVAAAEVVPPLQREVIGVVRSLRLHGAAAGLERAGGRARPLYAAAARAATTGAPVAGAVAAFVAARRDEERARRRAAGARLPVRMLVPLSLLILPGFVLLTVGPALLGAVRRLGLLGP